MLGLNYYSLEFTYIQTFEFLISDGAFVYDSKKEEMFHTLVLTDIEGTFKYLYCP